MRFESIRRDVEFGLRLCRRNKIVTAAAIVSLSLAIGACTAAYSLIDALILRPLPVDDPHSLIVVAQRAPGESRDALSFNYPLFAGMRDAGRPYVRLFAVSDQSRRDAALCLLAVGGKRSLRSARGFHPRVVGARRNRRPGVAHRLRERRQSARRTCNVPRARDGAASLDRGRALGRVEHRGAADLPAGRLRIVRARARAARGPCRSDDGAAFGMTVIHAMSRRFWHSGRMRS